MNWLIELFVRGFIEHWVLLAGFIAMGLWLWKHGIPGGVKMSLVNGGGTIVRGIVRTMNEEQTRHYEKMLDKAFLKHEELEALKVAAAVEAAKADAHACSEAIVTQLKVHDERLVRLEAYIHKKRRESRRKTPPPGTVPSGP